MNIIKNILFGFLVGFIGGFIYQEIDLYGDIHFINNSEKSSSIEAHTIKSINNSSEINIDEMIQSETDKSDYKDSEKVQLIEKIDHPDIKSI